MFKVPDWEADIPKDAFNFSKGVNNRKRKDDTIEPKDSRVNNFQDNNSKKIIKRKHNIEKVKTNKEKPSRSPNTSELNGESVLKESEGMEMDEILVNAKKRKVNEVYEKADCEELLFNEDPETNTTASKKLEKTKPKDTKRNNLSNKSKSNKKQKPENGEVDNDNDKLDAAVIKRKKVKSNESCTFQNGLTKISKPKKEKSENIKNIVKVRNKKNGEIGDGDEKSIAKIPVIEIPVKKIVNNRKKELIKKLLEQRPRSLINVTGSKLRERMLDRLKAAQFRYLNEKLYTSTGNEAQKIFESDPTAFRTYHQGYQQQVKKWPVNPLDIIVKKIQNMPKTFVIADMGCGEAALSRRVPQTVHSLDLVSSVAGVVACDMARTPLLSGAADVAVYCLALMGTELTQYLVEANRILKTGGHLLIAEVESRFDDVASFTKGVARLGFKLKSVNKEHSVFFFFHFVKVTEPPNKKSKLPALSLKPCLYKRR